MLKNFLKITRMYKLTYYRVRQDNKQYLSIKIHKSLVARLFATAVFTDVIETQGNLNTVSINGICKHKLSRVIANDLKHKKKQNQNGGFLSMSFEALTLFVYVKRKCSKKGTSRQRSGKGAIRKRFPLQKPSWEKTKLTIRFLYHETYRKPNEQLFSQ